jgi:hypothetical protein
MVAVSLLAGCGGPATTYSNPPEVRVVAPPTQAPAAMSAPLPEITLQERLHALAPGLDPGVLALALEARACALRNGDADEAARLAVIDYSKPSTAKRMWVFDMAQEKLLHHEHVSHGSGSGQNMATRFSNVEGSHATSLGLFRTAETYMGGNGYSLRMDGLEPGFNDNARMRAIVIHGAWYANPDMIARQGRLGRSQGCPALREQVAKIVIDDLKQRQLVFSYADDAEWLRRGRSFACDGRSAGQIIAAARAVQPAGGSLQAAVAAP